GRSGPWPTQREKLERVIAAGTDLIEFSMDAGDAETYGRLRPPRRGAPRDPQAWWEGHVDNVRTALELRKTYRTPTRVVVSIIRQAATEGKLESAIDFWLKRVGIDEVITRKFLTWDDNTRISPEKALDKQLYTGLPTERKEPCVWPFERLNVDTLGRVALCGQDISFRTSKFFPNIWESSIRDIWHGAAFNEYRRLHLNGRGAEAWHCRGCSDSLHGVCVVEHDCLL